MSNGRLYMIPVPIADGEPAQTLPISTIELIRSLRCFLVENAKTARAFLKMADHPGPIADLTIIEIGHRPDPALLSTFIQPLKEGKDVGILSEGRLPGNCGSGSPSCGAGAKRRNPGGADGRSLLHDPGFNGFRPGRPTLPFQRLCAHQRTATDPGNCRVGKTELPEVREKHSYLSKHLIETPVY